MNELENENNAKDAKRSSPLSFVRSPQGKGQSLFPVYFPPVPPPLCQDRLRVPPGLATQVLSPPETFPFEAGDLYPETYLVLDRRFTL